MYSPSIPLTLEPLGHLPAPPLTGFGSIAADKPPMNAPALFCSWESNLFGLWASLMRPNWNSGCLLFPGDYIQIQIQVLIFQNSLEIQMNSEFDQTSSVS
jgi:hypothetical protein